jgi:hypothetical protein
MSARDHVSPEQFYHGSPGDYEAFEPGKLLTPEGARNKHVYYTTDLGTASHHAGWGQPAKADGSPDFDSDARMGKVYAVQPETGTGPKIGRHATDPNESSTGPVRQGYRTRGQLRVLHEVNRETGERS